MDVASMMAKVRLHLEAAGHPFALAGAFALNAHGLPRETHDLDLVVPVEAQGGLIAVLESAGFETLHRSEGYSNHLHRDLGRVDLIYVDAATGAKLFGACRTVPFSDGSSVLLPTPEHLIAMKVQAIKNDPGRRFRDLADIDYLLQLPGVAQDQARGYFEKAELMEDWNELHRRR